MTIELWGWQQEALKFLDEANHQALLAMDMGTGKTLTTIRALRPDVRRVLVFSPLTPIDVFPAQMRKYAPETRWEFVPFRTPRGRRLNPSERMRALKETLDAQDVAVANGEPPYVVVMVVNYEAAWREPLGNLILKTKWDAIIADECHRLKTSASTISRFAGKLTRRNPDCARYGLSGTPMGQSPLDIWGQMRFINPNVLEGSWTQFRTRHAIMGGFEGRQVVGIRDQEGLMERLKPHMFRVMLRECMDLPRESDIIQLVELEPETRKQYQDMRKTFVAELANGEELTAANAAVKVMRLAQITGFSSTKRAALKELIEEAGDQNVVVFCRFSHDIQVVHDVCAEMGVLSGEVSGSRKDLGPGGCWPVEGPEGPIRVLAVQIQAGGAGIDLTAASVAIYFSSSYSVLDYEQSRARLVRPGQELPVRFYHLHVRGTVDELIYKALETKKSVVELALECLKGENDGD